MSDSTRFKAPGMLGRLQAAWYALRDRDTPVAAKLGIVVLGLGGLLLMVGYGVSPIDLLPELALGPAGLIDDLVLIPVLLWLLSRFMPQKTAERILAKFGKRAKRGEDQSKSETP